MQLRNGLLENRLIYEDSISLLYLPITIIFVACKHRYFNPPKVWSRILSMELCLLMIFLKLLVTKPPNQTRPNRRIFQGEKILSTPSFGGEVKPSVPCRRFTACKRFLNATWKSVISGKIHRPFLSHIVPPLATRISGGTTSGESWNV